MSELFFCWSGDRSHRLAHELKAHLPRFIPDLADAGRHRLYISDEIVKGTRWFDEVEEQLEKADVGIVCITREGLQSGWIHFEAGALARSIRRKRAEGATLFTYLLGVRVAELTGPLAEFQATVFDRDDTQRLCSALAGVVAPGVAGAATDWERAFTDNWAGFEAAVKHIGPQPATDLIPGLEELFRRKTFNEPIEECMRQSWIDRFTAARETLAALESQRATMSADNTYLLDLYNQLCAELDAYSMNMGALLLSEKQFEIDAESGRLLVGNGIRQACERRRGRIRQLVTHLVAPNCAPVLEESRRYAKMSSFEERKTLLIHPAEHELRRQTTSAVKTLWATELTADVLQRCAASLWEFDRICFYLAQEHDPSSDADELIDFVEQEFESVRAVDGGGSLVPLHYALRALKTRLAAAPVSAGLVDGDGLSRLLARIEQIIVELRLDPGRQVRDNLDVLRRLVAPASGPALLAG
jgi:hypothetical protein